MGLQWLEFERHGIGRHGRWCRGEFGVDWDSVEMVLMMIDRLLALRAHNLTFGYDCRGLK
jgi:hypothetical protein